MIRDITDSLLKDRNPDGGWGTYADRPTNVEATAFALMGLAAGLEASSDQSPAAIASARERLFALQGADGSWPLIEGQAASPAATAVAIIALSGFAGTADQTLDDSLRRAAAWLTPQEGDGAPWVKRFLHKWVPELSVVEADPDLKGWPWVAGTWSWVEPTAYAVLALKRAQRGGYAPDAVGARLEEAERMLYDRMCYGGGWNFGNKKVLGAELAPYPDITALTLIALQDHRASTANVQSLHALKAASDDNTSGLVAALTIICHSLYNRDDSAARTHLTGSFEHTGFIGDNKVRGLALLALGDHRRWTTVVETKPRDRR